MDHLFNLCLVFVTLLCLFIAALLSPAGKGLTSWLSFVMFNCVCHFPIWYGTMIHKTKTISRNTIKLGIITCNSSIYEMDHLKLIV